MVDRDSVPSGTKEGVFNVSKIKISLSPEQRTGVHYKIVFFLKVSVANLSYNPLVCYLAFFASLL